MEEMMEKDAVKNLPSLPGVYLMKDKSGRVLYVGKASNLRSRVASYFRRSGDQRPQIPALLARLASIDTLVTDNEKEALILENNLIKKYRPRYNLYFRDDKTYSSIRIDLQHPFPRPALVRRVKADGALYFGPYVAGRALKNTLRFLQKLFPYRICSDSAFQHRSRPCLYHQLGRCPAPCRDKISPGEYRRNIDGLILFLRGRKQELFRTLRRQMKEESDRLQYEAAARTRDRLRAIEETLEKQNVNRVDRRDRDVIALEGDQGCSVFRVLFLRGGKMLDGPSFFYDRLFPAPAEAITSFLTQYYAPPRPLPDEIILSPEPASPGPLKEILREWKRGPIVLTVPHRGAKLGWLELARKNARAELRSRRLQPAADEVLRNLREKLRLSRLPRRIECYDISNLGGREPVGAGVAFLDGKKFPGGYRRYRIRSGAGPDDCAMLAEILSRRLNRVQREGGGPDLIVVDGGKGQLNAALRVIRSQETGRPDLVALAKERRRASGRTVPDRVFIPGRKNPVPLRPGSPELLLLARIRDEAHRFAIGYHRRRRRKEVLSSPLDRIKGVGPVLKRRLLDRFGSLEKIRAAGPEGLISLPGIGPALAEEIIDRLQAAEGK